MARDILLSFISIFVAVDAIGVLPIFVSLTEGIEPRVGPAVLTTSMMIISQYGLFATLISVLANILLAGAIFCFSSVLIKVLGEAGSKALSKIMSLLLAAIAVMLIRKGILTFYG